MKKTRGHIFSKLPKRTFGCTMLLMISLMMVSASPTIPNEGITVANTRSTISASGVPAKVVVTLTPRIVFADNNQHSYVVKVELQDLYGNPAYAPDEGVGISLSSSNLAVGDIVDKTVTIGAGNTYLITHFRSTYLPGTTAVKAAAVGLIPGSAVMTTWGRMPSKLKLYLAPDKLLSDNDVYYNPVTVQLQDLNGNPAPAPQGGITVSLSSSNRVVGTVPTSLSISEGNTFGQTWFKSTMVAGTTTIYAASASFTGSTATMTTVTPGASGTTKLWLWLAPNKVPARGVWESYPVVVQLRDASDRPVKPPTTVTVNLYSSNPIVGTVTSTVSIGSSSCHAYASFASTVSPGSTQINAKSLGLTDSQTLTMNTDGNAPQKLAIFAAPSKVFAHRKTSVALIWVQLQDNSGNPAKAPSGGKTLTLTSSAPNIGTVPSTVTISGGLDSNYVHFDSTYVPGLTTIKAMDIGNEASVTVRTVAPSPLKLALELMPPRVFANNHIYYHIVRVMLQDANSNPALAPVGGITVTLTSSNVAIGTVQGSVIISEGSFYGTAWFTSKGVPGATTLTAAASINGVFKTASATMTTVAPTVNPPAKVAAIPLSKYPSLGGTYYDTVIVLLLDSNNYPANAPTGGIYVSLSSSDTLVGDLPNGLTISEGETLTSTWFRSKWSPGDATIVPAATGSFLTPIPRTVTTGVYTGTPKSYNFGGIVTLFYQNTFLAVGNAATSSEAMSAAVFAPALTAAGTLSPATKTDTLMTASEKTSKNIISFGYNNSLRTSYPLGIVVSQNANWFNITATSEALTCKFNKTEYPGKSVAIVYLRQEGARAIMFMWGYGWQGTYVAALFMSSQTNWQTYASKHLLFLQWTDANINGFVEMPEISMMSNA